MFKIDSRYVTKEVSEKVDVRLQLSIWSMIDKLKDNGEFKVDYLQIFKLRKYVNKVQIEHSQEIPKYKNVCEVELEDVEIQGKVKIYVIDSGEYSTMLFSYEY